MTPPEDDRALLERARRGDGRAFAALFDSHARAVFGFLRARGADAAEAEDVVQAAFVLLWEKRRDLELAGDSALPWLIGSARLLLLASRRRTARRRETLVAEPPGTPDAAPSPERAAELRELQGFATAAIARLAPADRDILELCVDQGLSYREAARRLHLTESTVRGRLARARRRLASEFDLLRGA